MSPSPPVGPGARMFRAVDRALFVAALVGRLREVGVGVGVHSATLLARALEVCPPREMSNLYWVARTTLVRDRDDIASFDAVFAAVFDESSLPVEPRQKDSEDLVVTMNGRVIRSSVPDLGSEVAAGRVDSGRRPQVVDDPDSDVVGRGAEICELLPAAMAHLADVPFDQLSLDDLRCLGEWLEDAVIHFPRRRTRRHERAPSGGTVDWRSTLRTARGTGGEPIVVSRRRPRTRLRPVVMIADVSGSMESFSRIHLHLMRALARGGGAEVFTLATSVRRVTVQLRDGDPQKAIDRLTEEVADRFGGTRIGVGVGELVRSPIWSSTVRGATVLITSDGWDSDPPEVLGRAMAGLARRAHRVIWINPRSAVASYRPLVGGMAAALPHVDEFLSGHSLTAMARVISAIEG